MLVEFIQRCAEGCQGLFDESRAFGGCSVFVDPLKFGVSGWKLANVCREPETKTIGVTSVDSTTAPGGGSPSPFAAGLLFASALCNPSIFGTLIPQPPPQNQKAASQKVTVRAPESGKCKWRPGGKSDNCLTDPITLT